MELHTPGLELGDFYILELPTYGKPEFYIQTVSYSYFHDRELKRAFPYGPTNIPENGMNWMQYARTIKYCSEHSGWPGKTVKEYLDGIGVDSSKVTVCKGVWDFYNKIGYDRKAKKYL